MGLPFGVWKLRKYLPVYILYKCAQPSLEDESTAFKSLQRKRSLISSPWSWIWRINLIFDPKEYNVRQPNFVPAASTSFFGSLARIVIVE
jgi:hypothetical protein